VELAGLRTAGRSDPTLLADMPSCGEFVKDKTKFVARQVAAPGRAEYFVDVGTYGSAAFAEHAVYRDEPTAPTVSFNSFGDAKVATVTLASSREEAAINSEGELGRVYQVPAGYSGWVSDVIRVEALDRDCGAAGGNVEFFLEICDAAPSIKVFRYDSRTGELQGEVEASHTNADDACGYAVSSEVGGASDFIAARDVNECTDASHNVVTIRNARILLVGSSVYVAKVSRKTPLVHALRKLTRAHPSQSRCPMRMSSAPAGVFAR